jgi:hypothetical protein
MQRSSLSVRPARLPPPARAPWAAARRTWRSHRTFRLARGAEIRVIAVLLAPARVDPGGQDMAVGQRAEPGIAIGWRQRHRIEPGDFRAIGNALSR